LIGVWLKDLESSHRRVGDLKASTPVCSCSTGSKVSLMKGRSYFRRQMIGSSHEWADNDRLQLLHYAGLIWHQCTRHEAPLPTFSAWLKEALIGLQSCLISDSERPVTAEKSQDPNRSKARLHSIFGNSRE